MKMKTGMGRKLRYGGVTAALTAAIIAIVIVVNVAFSALAQKLVWYTDLTPDLEFTLSDNCIELIKEGEIGFESESQASGASPLKQIDSFREKLRKENEGKEDKDKLSESEIIEQTKIKVIFCDTELAWSDDDLAMKWVWKTAADLKNEFPNYIDLKFVDIIRNPTAVDKYRENGQRNLTSTNVIVECGGEYRAYTLRNFYIFNTDDSETPWAYNAEKIFTSAFMAVTRAHTPVACFAVGHGMTLPSETFALNLVTAGYEVRTVDLSAKGKEGEIPEDCRLLILSSPLEDFTYANGVDGSVDEIGKIEKFLDEGNSLMVFMSSELTDRLVNLEEFLEEWGIAFERKADGNTYHPYRIQDLEHSFDAAGFTVRGEYVDYGLGGYITEEMRKLGRKIVFPNAMTVNYAESVSVEGYVEEEGGDVLGQYGVISNDGTSREVFPVFKAYDNAVAIANGVEVARTGNGNFLELMMVSVEDRRIAEDDYGYSSVDQASYVVACGCPELVSEEMLHGQFGNGMFLEYVLRTIGHEPVPVGLTFRPLGDYAIDTIETSAATWCTVLLTVIPAVISLGVGVIVIVRRKNR